MNRIWLAVVASAALVAGTAAPAGGSWASANCSPNHHDVTTWTRGDARAYAAVAIGEGYEWGGGCWNDNDRDDTPTDSDSDSDGGEGPDCSGFTFKTWMLRPTQGAAGGRWYDKFENIHGPYATSEYRNPGAESWPFHLAKHDKDALAQMDAYAKNGHIGMIYTLSTSANEDYIIEAYGKPANPPTGVFLRDYFGQSPTYWPVQREGWSPDCAPRCTRASATTVVVP